MLGPSPPTSGHTMLLFETFPLSLQVLLYAYHQDFSFRRGLVVSKVWDIIKKLKPGVGEGGQK